MSANEPLGTWTILSRTVSLFRVIISSSPFFAFADRHLEAIASYRQKVIIGQMRSLATAGEAVEPNKSRCGVQYVRRRARFCPQASGDKWHFCVILPCISRTYLPKAQEQSTHAHIF